MLLAPETTPSPDSIGRLRGRPLTIFAPTNALPSMAALDARAVERVGLGPASASLKEVAADAAGMAVARLAAALEEPV